MSWHETIRRLLASDSNHADNFNEVFGQLLENDKDLLKQINILSTSKFGCTFKAITSGSIKDINISDVYNIAPNVTDTPLSGWFKAYVYVMSSTNKQVFLLDINNNYYFTQCVNGAWGTWQQISTTEKVDISSNLIAGWVLADTAIPAILTTSGKMRSLSMYVKNPSSTEGLSIITTLVPEHRPSSPLYFEVKVLATQKQYDGLVWNDGNVGIGSPYTANEALIINVSWGVA